MKKMFVAMAIGLAVAAPLTAQSNQAAEQQVLAALLEEMRALRATLQKTAAYQVRAQLLLERMKLQQQSVRELQQQQEQWNLDRGMTLEHEPFEEMVGEMEERLRTESDSQRKMQIERELKGLERRREMEARHREQLQVRFQRLETRLAEENAKLRAIEEELTRLEAELTRQ